MPPSAVAAHRRLEELGARQGQPSRDSGRRASRGAVERERACQNASEPDRIVETGGVRARLDLLDLQKVQPPQPVHGPRAALQTLENELFLNGGLERRTHNLRDENEAAGDVENRHPLRGRTSRAPAVVEPSPKYGLELHCRRRVVASCGVGEAGGQDRQLEVREPLALDRAGTRCSLTTSSSRCCVPTGRTARRASAAR